MEVNPSSKTDFVSVEKEAEDHRETSLVVGAKEGRMDAEKAPVEHRKSSGALVVEGAFEDLETSP